MAGGIPLTDLVHFTVKEEDEPKRTSCIEVTVEFCKLVLGTSPLQSSDEVSSISVLSRYDQSRLIAKTKTR